MPTPPPITQAPGAGLPTFEAFLLRHLIFPLGSRLLHPAKAHATFQENGQQLLDLASKLSPEQLTTQVLIKRQRGLEDSSRNWSVAMVLHHLVITGTGMKQSIQLLNANKAVDRKVSTADVKPSPDTGPEIIDHFRSLLTDFPKGITTLSNSTATHHHPWFGELTAKNWLSLSAIHQSLHRKQAETIVAHLR